jgi:L-ornithine N5-monooxygenase
MQRIQDPDSSRWRCKIFTNRKITAVIKSTDGSSLLLQLAPTCEIGGDKAEEPVCEHVFVATGNTRNAYQDILKGTRPLLLEGRHGEAFPVGRDYGVMFNGEKVEGAAGMWLQGCKESTHGVSGYLFAASSVYVPQRAMRSAIWTTTNDLCAQLSNTFLSILAVRGGEIVESIFGMDLAGGSDRGRDGLCQGF